MPGRFHLRLNRSDDRPGAVSAVASDACGIVLLASPDGERFRTVERLAMTEAEAEAFYEASPGPTLSADDVRDLYGEEIAKLSLGRASA